MCTNDFENNAIDFLLYSYFNFDTSTSPEEMFDLMIKKAYEDATQQGAYNTLLQTDELKKASAKAYNDAVEILKDRITCLLSANDKTDIQMESSYDSWHETTCKEIKKIYNNKLNELFTYGNAQKWVNMTMKYILIVNSLIGKFEKICEIKEYLHIPVDNYMIEAIWDVTKIRLPLIEEKLLKNGTRGAYLPEKVKAWSKWDINDYIVFRDSLRNYLKEKNEKSPIEWEGPTWIKIAKKRKIVD